jgi:hypothetical protein
VVSDQFSLERRRLTLAHELAHRLIDTHSLSSGCLIDLRKGSLLEVFHRLPYEFLIPNTLFEEELPAFALAESYPGSILPSGDGELRKLATEHEMEVHGVLWVIDEIHRCKLTTMASLTRQYGCPDGKWLPISNATRATNDDYIP